MWHVDGLKIILRLWCIICSSVLLPFVSQQCPQWQWAQIALYALSQTFHFYNLLVLESNFRPDLFFFSYCSINNIHNALIVAKSQMFIEWLFHKCSRQESAQMFPPLVMLLCKQCRHKSKAYLASNPGSIGKLLKLSVSQFPHLLNGSIWSSQNHYEEQRGNIWKVPTRIISILIGPWKVFAKEMNNSKGKFQQIWTVFQIQQSFWSAMLMI